MSRSRSIYFTIAYACFALAIIVAATWIASAWFGAAYAFGNFRFIALTGGYVEYLHTPLVSPSNAWSGWAFFVKEQYPQVRFTTYYVNVPARMALGIPFWPLPLALVMIGVFSRRLAHRSCFDRCKNCHYDLRGLPANAPCPECGTHPKPTEQPT